jgi:hypothetical protein
MKANVFSMIVAVSAGKQPGFLWTLAGGSTEQNRLVAGNVGPVATHLSIPGYLLYDRPVGRCDSGHVAEGSPYLEQAI